MRYLELEELVVGKRYVCVPYDSSNEIIVTYTGNGNFEDDEYTYSVKGDIRYVVRPAFVVKFGKTDKCVSNVP